MLEYIGQLDIKSIVLHAIQKRCMCEQSEFCGLGVISIYFGNVFYGDQAYEIRVACANNLAFTNRIIII